MTELFIKWAFPALCTALAGWVTGYYSHRKKRDRAVEDGMQCVLRLEIIRAHENYSHKGFCPVYAREAITRAYNAYHELHGNDVATDLYERLMELPTSAEGSA